MLFLPYFQESTITNNFDAFELKMNLKALFQVSKQMRLVALQTISSWTKLGLSEVLLFLNLRHNKTDTIQYQPAK